MTTIAEMLADIRVVPVIRASDEDIGRRMVALLASCGFSTFEITLTTPGAMAMIRDLAKDPMVRIGVGTVLSREDGEAALEAGAEFVVSPGFVDGLAAPCREAGALLALGAATPSEAMRARAAGADIVKVFPAAQLGGPGFVKALRSVFPDMAIMPTGGIGPNDIVGYLSAGAMAVGMGGALVNEAALKAGDEDAIRAAAADIKAALA